MLVGAGGHFCPVGRWLNGPAAASRAPVVIAQEVEFAIDPGDAASFRTAPQTPELYFCRDLEGYGWCFRKQDYVNIGFGRIRSRSLPKATAEFVAFLESRRRIPAGRSWNWRGHAYLLQDASRRQVVEHGLILVGDAAGLAYPQSGEGIRPAIESGLLAALTIVEAGGLYTRNRLNAYERRLRARFDTPPFAQALSRIVPSGIWAPLAGVLLGMPRFVRHVALDRWFLHADQPALA
jgi:flavin-dependent dehydrogenase